MSSEKVGSLFVEVGVHGDKAITEALELHEALKKIARDLGKLGNGANFNALTQKLKAVNAQAQATQKNVAAAAGGGVSPAAATTAQSKILQQQINNAHAAALAEDKIRTAAAAKAQAQAQKQAASLAAAQTAAAKKSAQQQAAAAQAAQAAQTKAAQRAAAQQTAAQAKAAKDRQAIMLREAYAMNKAFDKEAKDAERAAARQVRAQQQASKSRLGALKRGGADFATGGAALFSGNPAYAAANFAQGITKMTGALSGMSTAALVATTSVGVLTAGALALEAAVIVIGAKLAAFGVQTAASFETLQIQLEGLLGSAQAGQDELTFLLNLGQTSIIPTESLIAADRQLAAFGVTATGVRRELVEFISDFGTATSATESQVYFLALAMGQVSAQGKANTIDLRQLANAGVKTRDIYEGVAKQLGISWQEVRDGVKDGIITSDLLFGALTKIGGKYDETAKKAMLSTNGLISNIKDIIAVGMGNAFKSLNKQVGLFLQSVSDAIKTIDFTQIAVSVQNAVDDIKRALGDVPSASDATVTLFNETIPNAIEFVGQDIAGLIKEIQMLKGMLEIAGMGVVYFMHAASAGVIEIAIAAYDATNAMTFGLGGLIDSATLKVRQGLVEAADYAADQAASVIDEIIKKSDELNAKWEVPAHKDLTYSIAYQSTYGPGGSVYNSQLGPYVLDAMKPVDKKDPPEIPPPGGGGGGGKALAAAKAVLAEWKTLVDQAIKGRDALRDAFTVAFAPKIIAAGGKAITAAFKQFSSGDVDTIVGQYKTIKQALVDYYSLAEEKGGSAAKGIANRRRADIAFLKKQTGELVLLATKAEQINKKLADAEEKYGKVTDAIDKQREAVSKQNDAQALKINRQYDGYYTAISKTSGKFVKGAIQAAQEALDAATIAYDKAQEKLDALKQARDDFLSSMREMALSFVNDLSKVREEITVFTRLDSVGSFSSVTKEIASTQSFTAGLKARLQALKDFAANVKALVAKGLDKSLIQTILQGGPDANGAIATELAGASAAEIADINSVQADLARTITGMQTEASAAWFDAGIAAQEAFTAPLKSAMTAAQTQVDELNRQKELALGILQAWYDDQNAMFDQQEEVAKAQYEAQKAALETALKANQTAAEKIAAAIDARMSKIPKTAYATGLNTISGIINGLNDKAKLAELKAAAARVADIIQRTIRSALRVNSPSQVMMEIGQFVGQGLAVGMGMSEPLVADAAASLASSAVASVPGGGRNTMVKVYIGDKELTDLVDLRIESSDEASLNYLTTGRRF